MIRARRTGLRLPLQCPSARLALGLGLALALGLTLLQPLASAAQSAATSGRQEFTITVTDQGFEPARLSLKKDVPARLTFVRTAEKSCATEVLIPSLKVKKELPLQARVSIQFTPQTTGEIGFTCGQQMFKGALVVE